MEAAIRNEIVRHAKAVLRKYEIQRRLVARYAQNYQKRTGDKPNKKAIAAPDTWSLHPHFDPRYCIRHRKYLAKVIWSKIKAGNYEPIPAIALNIPKGNGEYRQIMVFAVPDAAVAKLFRSSLTMRNSKLFSANSYAYRFDRNLWDALLYLQAAVKGEKVFIIQYDFKKYFDLIPHQYLHRLIESERIFLTSIIEKSIIRSFLVHQYAAKKSYTSKTFERKVSGIPQGSSMSLWLANVAGHELDRDLERRNGQFSRYADDAVCIAHSYEDALSVARAFEEHCRRSGLEINKQKSPGINLLSDPVLNKSDLSNLVIKEEMRCIEHFDYLGHRFTKKGIYLTDKAIDRIKHKITTIIQVHLIHYPRSKKFNAGRIGPGFFDWDLVTCLNEVRRYIYGGLRESEIHSLIFNNIRLPKVRGLMSFYILLSDATQLRELDGWLLTNIKRALVERYKLLNTNFGISQIPPTKQSLKLGSWYSFQSVNVETRCPSFLRAWRGARKYYFRFGLGDVDPPDYYGYGGGPSSL